MKKHPGFWLIVSLSITTVASAGERPELDAFFERREVRPLPGKASVAHQEKRLGVPKFVWGSRQSPPGLTREAHPRDAARAHLRANAGLFRLSGREVSEAVVREVHDRGDGAVVVQFTQSIDGRDVFRNRLSVAMDRDHRLVALAGHLAPSEFVDRARRHAAPRGLAASDAVALAFADLTGLRIGTEELTPPTFQPGGYLSYRLDSAVLTWRMATPARAKEVYFTLPDRLEAAYYVEIDAGRWTENDSALFGYVLSAVDGRILFRHDLTHAESFGYRVWADPASYVPYDGPHGSAASPHPSGAPDGYEAPFVSPELVSLQNVPFSQNDGWLPDGATTSVGNNVDAYADLFEPDGFQAETDTRASTTGSATFDHTFDPTLGAAVNSTQLQGAVVSLFYVSNFLHDWFYDHGFDEAAGNAQVSNYGRGGLENDSLRVEAQDYSWRNGANMTTPADGAGPRLQMYLFDAPPLLRVTSPPSMEGNYSGGFAATFGAQTFQVTGDLAIANPLGTTTACSAFDPGTFAGKIALLDRGGCVYTTKAKNAQEAGAIGVVIANNVVGQAAMTMTGADATITLPAMSTTLTVAEAWKGEVAANGTTLTVLMHRHPDLDRDSSLDSSLVAHEWGHYLSNRLVSNASGLTGVQGLALGEGWGDTVALLVSVRDDDRTLTGNDQFQGSYAVSTYAESGGATNGNYYGARRVPYSVDLAKNALTLRHISVGEALPTAHPLQAVNGGTNSEAHNAGEVWATMLWECYQSLLIAHPFAEAQSRWKSYLVASLKLTPPGPTFLEARDALLAAAAATDPADYERFVAAFARRGAGFGAEVPVGDSQDLYPVVESYETGNNLRVDALSLDDSLSGCDRDGVLDVGEEGSLSITVTNTGAGTLASFNAAVTASQATATLSFPDGNSAAFPSMAAGESVTRTVRVRLTETSSASPTAGLTLDFDEPSLPAASRTATHDAPVHYDEEPSASATETAEGQGFVWASTTASGGADWTRTGPAGSRYFHADDRAERTDAQLTSPWLQVAGSGSFVITLRHRYSFETYAGFAPYFDGGVIELSTDGTTWRDLYGDLGVNPGYTGTLDHGDSPLTGRAAYVYANSGFPAWTTRTIDLGTAFAGQAVQVRFRLGTNGATGAYGWDIDEVAFANATSTPFSELRADVSSSCNQRPVANAGPAQSVSVGMQVQLDGTASIDPDGSPLTFTWTQVAGPAVSLLDATTATPTFSTAGVSLGTAFTFQLVVGDGTDESHPVTVTIAATDPNQAPTAVASASATAVAERTLATIQLLSDGSSDPESDPLTYEWTQTAGPTVQLFDATTATARFATPEVSEDTAFEFTLIVRDAALAGAPATVTVLVTEVDRAPVAEAGADLTVVGLESVTLQGTASDEDGQEITAWQWTQTEGPTASLSANDVAAPSVTAPDVTASTTLTFSLVAYTGAVASAPDTVVITVTPRNRRPVAAVPAPFDADERDTVTLSGDASSDPDGDALTYQWTQTAGPFVILTSVGADSVSFTAPDVLADTKLTFTLAVTDPAGAESLPAIAEVTVLQVNRAPVAVARHLGSAVAGGQVTLDAATSSDPDGDSLTYQWSQTSGAAVSLSSSTSVTVSFEAPAQAQQLEFQVIVTDAGGLTATSRVSVNVAATPTEEPDPEPTGCGGCATSGGSGGTLWAAFLLVLAFRRRGAAGAGSRGV